MFYIDATGKIVVLSGADEKKQNANTAAHEKLYANLYKKFKTDDTEILEKVCYMEEK